MIAKIKEFEIADLHCSEIKSQHLVQFAKSLKVQPQTRANYLIHLAAVFRVARPLWPTPSTFNNKSRRCQPVGRGLSTRCQHHRRRQHTLALHRAYRLRCRPHTPSILMRLFT